MRYTITSRRIAEGGEIELPDGTIVMDAFWSHNNQAFQVWCLTPTEDQPVRVL